MYTQMKERRKTYKCNHILFYSLDMYSFESREISEHISR